jgi:hypothetical protein
MLILVDDVFVLGFSQFLHNDNHLYTFTKAESESLSHSVELKTLLQIWSSYHSVNVSLN